MITRYNERGKFFTDKITKNAVPAIVQTITHRIEGILYVRSDERFLDTFNHVQSFIAITDAVIFDAHGQQLYQSNFIAINRDIIVWMLPQEDKPSSL
jgi:hypothetical protein